MKITLIRPLPDLNRWSMDLYSDQLFNNLKTRLRPQDELSIFPDPKNTAPWRSDVRKISGKWKRWLQQYFLMGNEIKKLNSDIFHITDNGYANLIPYLKGKRIVVTFYDALLPNLARELLPVDWKPRRSILAQTYTLGCLKKANHVITSSDFSRQELLKYSAVPLEKISTVYLAAGHSFYETISSEDKNVFLNQRNLLNKTIILLPGRSYPHKNIEGSLRVFARLIREQSQNNTVLLKIGSPLTASQKKLARELGVLSQVQVLENIPSRDLPMVYQISHAVLFLSFYEGFGLPVLEAMASRVPILISNRGSLPEIAGGNALIADPQNEDECVKALSRILTDVKLRSELIDKGTAWVQKFSWQETAKKTMEIYRKVYASKMG